VSTGSWSDCDGFVECEFKHFYFLDANVVQHEERKKKPACFQQRLNMLLAANDSIARYSCR
jgi:hypothetical protein